MPVFAVFAASVVVDRQPRGQKLVGCVKCDCECVMCRRVVSAGGSLQRLHEPAIREGWPRVVRWCDCSARSLGLQLCCPRTEWTRSSPAHESGAFRELRRAPLARSANIGHAPPSSCERKAPDSWIWVRRVERTGRVGHTCVNDNVRCHGGTQQFHRSVVRWVTRWVTRWARCMCADL